MATRKFHCPLSVLLGSSRRLYDALIDPDYVKATADRPNGPTDVPPDGSAPRFQANIVAFSTGQSSQNSQTGAADTLTKDQTADLLEMERLVAGARRSARLAFPDDPVKLHSEFQVGISDPATLDAELERAGIIADSCQDADNAAALKAQGWTAADATALAAAVGRFSATALDKEEAFDDRIGLTGQKIVAANAVYADTPSIQNAARLQYPANQPGTEAARARFLLDSYPPRDRSDPSAGTPPPTPVKPVKPTA